MKKLVQRLLLFIIGVPLIAALVLFLPFYRHLLLNIIITIFSAMGALEFSAMLAKKQLFIPRPLAFVLGALAPAAQTLVLCINCPQWTIPLVLMAGGCWVLLSRVFSSAQKLEAVAGYIAAGFSVLIYPGLFMLWLVAMSAWENSSIIILVFLLVSMGSDSAAWAAGMLFGKGNRGIIPASPNKSVAGFVGGAAGSIIVSCGAALIVPYVFVSRFAAIPALCAVVILGLCTGAAAALGDLAESAIKRSCGFKDSGNIMLGRGGVLDSIDSIAVASPVFYLLFTVLFIN